MDICFILVCAAILSVVSVPVDERCAPCWCDSSIMVCEGVKFLPQFNYEIERLLIKDVKHSKLLEKEISLPNVIEFVAENSIFSRTSLDQIFFNMRKLEQVEIRKSQVTNLSHSLFENNPRITTVRFPNNLISDVPLSLFWNLRSLKIVDLENNRVSTIKIGTFIKNDMLKKINLSQNNIDRLEAGAFNLPAPSVIHLNISWNLLRELPGSMFILCSGLQILDVSHNRIETVYPKAFQGLSSLEELFLQGNNLQTVDSVCSEALGALRVLNLQMNPLTPSRCSDSAILKCKELCKQVFLSICDCFSTRRTDSTLAYSLDTTTAPSGQVALGTALEEQSTIASKRDVALGTALEEKSTIASTTDVAMETDLEELSTITSETYVSSESSTISLVTKGEHQLTSSAANSRVSLKSVSTAVDANASKFLIQTQSPKIQTTSLLQTTVFVSQNNTYTSAFRITDEEKGKHSIFTSTSPIVQTVKYSTSINPVPTSKIEESTEKIQKASVVETFEFRIGFYLICTFFLILCLGVMGVSIFKLVQRYRWRDHIYDQIEIGNI